MNKNPLQSPLGGIDVKQTTEVKCDSCGNTVFNQGVLMRKVSALVNPDGKEGYLPIPTFYCTSCGSVNSEFIPKELQNKIQLA